MIPTIFEECIAIISDLVGHDYLYFDDPIEIKNSPHTHPFSAWAVSVSPAGALYLMDGEEQWHQVELGDTNATLVVGSLYQRLKLMRIGYAKAS